MASPSKPARDFCHVTLKYRSLVFDWQFLEDKDDIINIHVPVLNPVAQSDYPKSVCGIIECFLPVVERDTF